MMIGERLQLLREEQKLSQGDIEKRTGLLRCYISRVENGHTVPAIETLEKLARAMGLPSTSFSMMERNHQSCRNEACQTLHYFVGEKSAGRMKVEFTFSTSLSACSDFTIS